MNQTQIMPASKNDAALAAAPVCRTVPLRRLPGASRQELAFCNLPHQDSADQLTLAFQSAPQFSQISLEKLMERKGSDSFRVVLLGENDYYLRQAAAYLTALAQKTVKTAPAADRYWDDLDLDTYCDHEDTSVSASIKDALVVVSASMLDPSLVLGDAPMGKAGPMAQMMGEQKQINLTDLESAGVLIAAQSGPVLSEDILSKLESFLEKEHPQNLFVAA